MLSYNTLDDDRIPSKGDKLTEIAESCVSTNDNSPSRISSKLVSLEGSSPISTDQESNGKIEIPFLTNDMPAAHFSDCGEADISDIEESARYSRPGTSRMDEESSTHITRTLADHLFENNLNEPQKKTFTLLRNTTTYGHLYPQPSETEASHSSGRGTRSCSFRSKDLEHSSASSDVGELTGVFAAQRGWKKLAITDKKQKVQRHSFPQLIETLRDNELISAQGSAPIEMPAGYDRTKYEKSRDTVQGFLRRTPLHSQRNAAAVLNTSENEKTITDTTPLLPAKKGIGEDNTNIIYFTGLMACLAGTDAPHVVLDAHIGSHYQYSFLFANICLIPILYMAQELTARLGLYTKCGMAELIKSRHGLFPSCIFATYVGIICFGALITEILAISQIVSILGISIEVAIIGIFLFLASIPLCHNLQTVEIIGIVIGSLQLIFIPVAFITKPNWQQVEHQMMDYSNTADKMAQHSDWRAFIVLQAANIGAALMPWMLFYQQSSLGVKQNTTIQHLAHARSDAVTGATIRQIINCAIVTAYAAAASNLKDGADRISSINAVIERLVPYVGNGLAGKYFICIGFIGGSLLACLVLTLSLSWTLAEISGAPRNLGLKVKDAAQFYAGYYIIIFFGLTTSISLGIERANIFCIVMQLFNTFSLPIILVLLVHFCMKDEGLPDHIKLQGWYKWAIILTFGFLCLFSLSTIPLIAYKKLEGHTMLAASFLQKH